ncbi:aminoglycoside phosphotransferase family protein [Streptomyces sp. 8K308]|uniref:phosphotransferase n=1 Tax=Streptomyces sp. 8K308 TaxID=2530388 RepID=UPI0010491B5F|nr:phosphotransferase [Streptomyces sp. 8K308]TDC25358.1 aminoglycoside phosphotransferase family protein [Streptomyces sp. 8K308]
MTAGEERALAGGMANAGAVTLRGDVVRRPAPANAKAIHDHLRALRRQGFDGAPRPLRITADGREELGFVPGDVALPPFPAWVLTDEALASVGRLLRRLHEASAAIPLAPAAAWSRELSDPAGGPLLCHNDVCPENVVFRDGRAVALIDFDLAAPGRPIWDVAMAARYWVPMRDPETARRTHPQPLDPAARLRLLADSYGLSGAERAELPLVIEEATAAGRAFVAARVDRGDATYLAALARSGGWAGWDRLRSWLEANRRRFTAALTE